MSTRTETAKLLVETVFTRERLFWLSEEQAAALDRAGSLPFDQNQTGPAIAVDRSRSNFFFEFDPATDLNHLLNCGRLVTCDRDHAMLRLNDARDLRSLLLAHAPLLGARAAPVPRRHLDGTDDEQCWWQDAPTNELTSTLASQSYFLGQAAICGCSVAGCSAEYAWIEDDVMLLYVRIVAVGIREIRFGALRIQR